MLVRVRDERCRARPIELLSCSPRMEVAAMRLQPVGKQLSPLVIAIVALLAWRLPPLLPLPWHKGGREGVRAGVGA